MQRKVLWINNVIGDKFLEVSVANLLKEMNKMSVRNFGARVVWAQITSGSFKLYRSLASLLDMCGLFSGFCFVYILDSELTVRGLELIKTYFFTTLGVKVVAIGIRITLFLSIFLGIKIRFYSYKKTDYFKMSNYFLTFFLNTRAVPVFIF